MGEARADREPIDGPEREDHDTKLWQTTKEVFPGH
jgi:hypothetical protein